MLTFLNNVFLPALAAGVLPILIHLLTRRRLLRQDWPSLRFLLEIQKRQMRKLKLKQILLLILRVLILLLVIGAFARPAIRGITGGGVGAHENTSVAILIDRSYSMGQEAAGVDLFAKARHLSGDIFALLKEGDELLIVPFDKNPHPLTNEPSRILAGAHDAIDSLRLSNSVTDIWAAATFAVEKLRESRLLHREIYILTDNKASGWRRAGRLDIPERMRLYAVALAPDDERNLGVTAIEFPRTLLQRQVPFTLTAEVKSFAPGGVSDHVVDLYVDGKRVAQASVDLPPGAAAQVKLAAEVETGGFHAGRIELEGDALPADNNRYFSFRIPEKLDVLVIGGAESGFIRAALAPGSDDFFRVKRVGYSQFGGQLLSAYDVVVLSDPPVISSALNAAIKGFIQRGGGLMLLLGGSPDPKKTVIDLFGENGEFEVLAVIGDTTGFGRLELGKADFDHPVLNPYAGEGIPQVSFRRIAAIERSPSVMLTFSNGLPAIAEGTIGEGKVALCGFSADLHYGGLATSGFFVPIMHRLTQYLASDIAAFDPGYLVGDDAVRTITDFPTKTGAVKLVYPGGGSRFATPKFVGGKAVITTGTLDRAGIYSIFADTILVDLFAVNIDHSESEPAVLDRGIAGNIAPVIWLSPEGDIEEEILSARYGVELHHGMLIFAFILMLVELALGGTWRRPRDYSTDIKEHGGVL